MLSKKTTFLYQWLGFALLTLMGILSTSLIASLPTEDLVKQLHQLPLTFEKNEGQTDASVHYFSRAKNYTCYFTSQEMVMVLQDPSAVLRMQFLGAQLSPYIQGIQELSQKSNYFIGNDPAKWRTSIPHYAHVHYQNLYPGIDASFYGNPNQIEYDILIAPGSSPQDIRLQITGAENLVLDQEGDLHLILDAQHEVQMLKPVVYQMQGENKVFIEGQFALFPDQTVGFAIGDYDTHAVLIIDPVFNYSSFLGGSSTDSGDGIAVDSFGNAYVTGSTTSLNFPSVGNPFQPSLEGMENAFITKINPTGTAIIYSTFLGGSNTDLGFDIALDSSGNAYVTGNTSSPDFPIAGTPFQSTFGGVSDAFVTKINPAGTALVYSSFLGGSNLDLGNSIAVDTFGNAYVTGLTLSTNFPTAGTPFQPMFNGVQDAFIAKFAIGTPTVISVVPNQGPPSGGTEVTITGTNFVNVISVSFGGVPAASFIVVNDTQITAVSPPGVGTVDVRVTTVGGTSPITPADQFSYVPFVTTTSLIASPNPAAVGQPVTLIATVTPSTATGTVTFFDGATPIGTVPVINGTAIFITSSLSVGPHSITAAYSGDIDNLPSVSTAVIVLIEAPFPPRDLKVCRKLKHCKERVEYVNVLTWKAPLTGISLAEYRIYRDATLTQLVAVIPADQALCFKDHYCKKGITYSYFVVSVDQFGNVSAPASVSIRG